MSPADPSLFQYLSVHSADGVLRVTIERAEKRNALSQAVLGELGQCFRSHAADPTLIVAVLTGAGDRCFAAGGDLREFDQMRGPDDAARIGLHSTAALDAIREFPVPVIAALNGDAIGGGAELAVACDIRIAAAHARIAFVQGTLNISPAWGGGTDLCRLVGAAQALRLLCRADFLDVAEAEALGLLQARAGAGESFAAFLDTFLAPIRARRPQVTRAFKRLARAEREGASPTVLREIELAELAVTWSHDDHWQAHDAVLARISR